MHPPVSKFLILSLFKFLLSRNIHWPTTSEHLLRLLYDSYFLSAKFWVKVITTRTATAFRNQPKYQLVHVKCSDLEPVQPLQDSLGIYAPALSTAVPLSVLDF
jgi:hypothetical protein